MQSVLDKLRVGLQSFPHDCEMQADIVAFSGSTLVPLIRQLSRFRARIRLLVCDPLFIIGQSGWGEDAKEKQNIRILDTFYTLTSEAQTYTLSGDYQFTELHIRLYRSPASVAGVLVRAGNRRFLATGWYMYENGPGGYDVWGSEKPGFLEPGATEKSSVLCQMFASHFRIKWDASCERTRLITRVSTDGGEAHLDDSPEWSTCIKEAMRWRQERGGSRPSKNP